MSFGGRFSDLLTGSPAGTADALEAAGEKADAANQAINQDLLAQGKLSQAAYDQTVADFNQSNLDGAGGIGGQLADAFAEGAKEGLNAELALPGQVVGGVTGGAGKLLWGIVKNIPWWLWLAGAGALFVWMG